MKGRAPRAADAYVEQRHAALRDAVRRHGDAKAAPLPLALVENGSRAPSDGDGEKLLGSDRPWRPDAFAQARARSSLMNCAGSAHGAPDGQRRACTSGRWWAEAGVHAGARRAGRCRRARSCGRSAASDVACPIAPCLTQAGRRARR